MSVIDMIAPLRIKNLLDVFVLHAFAFLSLHVSLIIFLLSKMYKNPIINVDTCHMSRQQSWTLV